MRVVYAVSALSALPALMAAGATDKIATLAPAPSLTDEIARNHFRDQIRALQQEVKSLNATLISEKSKGMANELELKTLRLNEKAFKDLKNFEKKQTAALEKQKSELKACVHDARNKCMWLENALDCEAAKFDKCFGDVTDDEEEEKEKEAKAEAAGKEAKELPAKKETKKEKKETKKAEPTVNATKAKP